MTDVTDVRFGRVEAEDPRDNGYPMGAQLASAASAPSSYRYWLPGPYLNQNRTSVGGSIRPTNSCVGMACTAWDMCSPVRGRGLSTDTAFALYRRCLQIDEFSWDWPVDQGTSVRAGLKVLQEQGKIESYHWAADVRDIIGWVLTTGPVIAGTQWYQGMMDPDDNGFLRPTGQRVGGHAYLLIGYSLRRDAFRMLNSWGRAWGDNARAWITAEDMTRLLLERGEVVAAVQKVS